MSAVARLLLMQGFRVSGSDVKKSANVAALTALGAKVFLSHNPDNIGDARAIITTDALNKENLEVIEAKRRGLPILPRGEALAMLMKGKRGIAVTGTAGKSSTSAMLAMAVRRSRPDASYAIGAMMLDVDTNAGFGAGPIFIAEADESQNSFLRLSPDIALITNVESDHLEFHETAQNYRKAFRRFVDRVSQDGLLITSGDDPGAREVAEYAKDRIRVKTFGESDGCDMQIGNIRMNGEGATYTATCGSLLEIAVTIRQPGRHMVRNSAAALLTALQLDIPAEEIVGALKAYKGLSRRFELIGNEGGISVYDDFGDTPTKIREQLRAARVVAEGNRVWITLEAPTIESKQGAESKRELASAYAAELVQADGVLMIDGVGALGSGVMASLGNRSSWLTHLIVQELMILGREVRVLGRDADAVAAIVAANLRAGDIAVTMGGQDQSDVARSIICALKRS